MAEMLKIVWEVNDGYAGKARPQTTKIHLEDLEGLSEKDRDALINEYILDQLSEMSFTIVSMEEV